MAAMHGSYHQHCICIHSTSILYICKVQRKTRFEQKNIKNNKNYVLPCKPGQHDPTSHLRPCLLPPKNPNFFQDFLLHQIFRRMHRVLNIDKNKN
jgi:hypothetical protein